MATVRDLAAAALRDLGVLAAGEALTADDAADALAALNGLIDEYKTHPQLSYVTSRTVFTISQTQDYTVGSGQTVNLDRPVWIDHVNFQDTNVSPTREYPMDKMTDDAWAALPQRTRTGPLPCFWYYNATFPYGTLSLYPIPTQAGLQGVIYAKSVVAEFATIDDAIALPPGYRRMLQKNLAVEIAPSYGVEPNGLLVRAAASSMAAVKRSNRELADLAVDPGALVQRARPYSIRRGF